MIYEALFHVIFPQGYYLPVLNWSHCFIVICDKVLSHWSLDWDWNLVDKKSACAVWYDRLACKYLLNCVSTDENIQCIVCVETISLELRQQVCVKFNATVLCTPYAQF